jgi:cellulose synthase/poly-beta-1,6-N-acetylglucosamine synthase-like glycosyltransferase
MLETTFLHYGYILAALGMFFLMMTLANLAWQGWHTRRPETGKGVLSPMVSVLVPARNEEANIAACLDALLAQDYENYEILVIDDNSEDATWSIIQR